MRIVLRKDANSPNEHLCCFGYDFAVAFFLFPLLTFEFDTIQATFFSALPLDEFGFGFHFGIGVSVFSFIFSGFTLTFLYHSIHKTNKAPFLVHLVVTIAIEY